MTGNLFMERAAPQDAEDDEGISSSARVGIIIGCVVAVGIVAAVCYALYRRFCASRELTPEERYPAAEIVSENEELGEVEGAVMVPLENKSMFLNQNRSIALTLIQSETDNGDNADLPVFEDDKERTGNSSVSSFSSNCSTCGEQAHHNINDSMGSRGLEGLPPLNEYPPTSSFAGIRDPNMPPRRRVVQFRSLPGSPTVRPPPMMTSGGGGGGGSAYEFPTTNEPFSSTAEAEENVGSPMSPRQRQHHHCHHHADDSPTSPTHHNNHSHKADDSPHYPSQKVDESTHKVCKLYKRRDASLVYGSSSYFTSDTTP